MTVKRWNALGLAGALAMALGVSAQAANLLENDGFEAYPASNPGNNLAYPGLADVTPWQAKALPLGRPASIMALVNLVRVDGPGGYHYGGQGPESDASNAGAGVVRHYLDGLGDVLVWQNFTAPCDGQVDVRASFSPRKNTPSASAFALVPVGPVLPVHSAYVRGPASAEVLDMAQRFDANPARASVSFPAGSAIEQWRSASLVVPVQAGQDYAFVVRLDEDQNLDQASVEYVAGQGVQTCVSVVSEPEITDKPGRGDGGGETPGTGGPISPLPTPLPGEIKQLRLQKSCRAPQPETLAGIAGMRWECEITLDIAPAPFAGTFQLSEDASAISGADATFLSASLPCSGIGTDQLNCQIDGTTLTSPLSLQVDLFAAPDDSGAPVSWENCVSGIAVTDTDKWQADRACAQTEFKPGTGDGKPDLPGGEQFFLKKACDTPRAAVENGVEGVAWSCEVNIFALPAPFAGSFSFDEDASALTGASGGMITAISGNPAWLCGTLPASQTSCAISGADFSPGGQESLVIDLFAPAREPVTWKNCVSGTYAGPDGTRDVAGNCDTMAWKPEPPRLPDPRDGSITKTCGAPHAEIHNGQIRGLSWECEVTVQAAPAPFAGSFSFDEDATALTGATGARFISVSASPGWSCTPQPGSGQAVSTCSIDGADFAPSGQEVLTFGLFADMSGSQPVDWKNCVSGGFDPAIGSPFAACDTAGWTPPVPSLDVVKTCDPAVDNGQNGWDVTCTLTVTGANLPPNQPLQISDVLTATGAAQANSSALAATGSGPFNCNAANASSALCSLTTDDLMAAGGTLVFTYTGTLQSLGGEGSAENCAWADVPGSAIHGPVNARGKSCVMLALPPVTPPSGSGVNCGQDVLFVLDRSGSMRAGNRIAMLRSGVQMAMNAFEGNGSRAGLVVFSSAAHALVNPPETLPSANMVAHVAGLQTGGATRWDLGLAEAAQIVAAETEKPLVLFVTDGVPFPFAAQAGAVPHVAAIRAQGSRIIGIALGAGAQVNRLTQLLGPNVANVQLGDPVDPFTNDVIVIPQAGQMPATFAALAQAYCPTRGARRDISRVVDLGLPVEPYAGDDDLPVAEQPTPPTRPSLSLEKAALGDCRVDPGKRRYECSFALTVTNTGTQALSGPVSVVDRPGTPAPIAINASGDGWQCDRLRNGELTCLAPDLRLAPGESSRITVRASIAGDPPGGPRWPNCAAIDLPDGKAGRVALAQRMMNARGIDAGPVDGAPGPQTYGALAQLQAELGLPESRAFDDRLFAALGLVSDGPDACARATLPPMPRPELRCDRTTTRPVDGACACSDPNRMVRRSATSCACRNGLPAINGRCVSVEVKPGGGDAPNGGCKLSVNGICLQR